MKVEETKYIATHLCSKCTKAYKEFMKNGK